MLVCERHNRYYSGGFSGGAEPATPLPAFGRRTDAVAVLLISENGTVLWRVLNFDRFTVKHAVQNTQND